MAQTCSIYFTVAAAFDCYVAVRFFWKCLEIWLVLFRCVGNVHLVAIAPQNGLGILCTLIYSFCNILCVYRTESSVIFGLYSWSFNLELPLLVTTNLCILYEHTVEWFQLGGGFCWGGVWRTLHWINLNGRQWRRRSTRQFFAPCFEACFGRIWTNLKTITGKLLDQLFCVQYCTILCDFRSLISASVFTMEVR